MKEKKFKKDDNKPKINTLKRNKATVFSIYIF